MSRSIQNNFSHENKEALAIIREEQASPPATSSVNISASNVPVAEELKKDLTKCICKQYAEASKVKIAPSHVEEILKERETILREEYDAILEREKENIKERFNFILSNEQTRASYMLREAHRERQEKIHALKTQLQCKNLAALMYVMCTERRRSKMEKLKIIEDYKKYINVLHDILTRGQELILHLSRGYKTAARVDHEWREKMKNVIKEQDDQSPQATPVHEHNAKISHYPLPYLSEGGNPTPDATAIITSTPQFMAFICHFAGGDPETNQYLIDLPKLLTTQAPLEVNSKEDPCDCDDEEADQPLTDEPPKPKEWWEDMSPENRLFVMYGDIADFNPDRRREVLKQIREAGRIRSKKTAPKEWKELRFKDLYMKSECAHLDKIKDMYPEYMPVAVKWECTHSPPEADLKTYSKMSMSPYNRTASVDFRGTMGSMLKMITLGPTTAPVPAKTELLGARDSMEITSTTRLRNSIKTEGVHSPEPVVLNIGKKRGSVFVENDTEDEIERRMTPPLHEPISDNDDAAIDDSTSNLGSIHNDSLQMIQIRYPEVDHKINYERVCPMDKCQRMQVDSFMRTLPPYMRANPFTNFEQTFDQYETCTPEQLKILQERIEHKKQKPQEIEDESDLKSPLSEWLNTGVGVQTSDLNLLPPCTCEEDSPESSASCNFVFDVADLEPVKLAMDAVHRECLFNERVEFDRFKLIGEETDSWKERQEMDFKQSRYQEISEILEKHPSLLDIFQANTQ